VCGDRISSLRADILGALALYPFGQGSSQLHKASCRKQKKDLIDRSGLFFVYGSLLCAAGCYLGRMGTRLTRQGCRRAATKSCLHTQPEPSVRTNLCTSSSHLSAVGISVPHHVRATTSESTIRHIMSRGG